MPTGAASFEAAPWPANCAGTTWSDRWAESAPRATTPPWSFWSLLQTNVLNQQRWTTRQELRLAIVVWIERKYHRQRAQDSLGGLTPIEFEAKLAEPLTLAA
jgi:transposase InsO family protein